MTSRRLFPLLLSFVVAGCGLDVDFWDEREFDVDVPGSVEPKIDATVDVDLEDNAQFKEVLAKLQSVDVVEIWLDVPRVDANNKATKASGRILVSELEDGAEKILVASYSDLVIAEGGKIRLTWSEEGYARLKELAFKAPHRFRLFVEGSLDQSPADFKLRSRLHVVAAAGL